MPGVMAVGEYSYRGDRFSYKGRLSEEQARMASVMCRATTLGVHMQAKILGSFCPDCGTTPARGWAVTGPRFSVCVFANVFCFLDNERASVSEVLHALREGLNHASEALV